MSDKGQGNAMRGHMWWTLAGVACVIVLTAFEAAPAELMSDQLSNDWGAKPWTPQQTLLGVERYLRQLRARSIRRRL
jgi:hypothetical protein